MKVISARKVSQRALVGALGLSLGYFSTLGGAYAIDKHEDQELLKSLNPTAYEEVYEDTSYEYLSDNPKHETNSKITHQIDHFLKSKHNYENDKSIEVDLFHYEIKDVLANCPNLEEITIKNAALLKDEDIELINSSNIKHVDLFFDYNEYSNEFDNHFDVSRIHKDYTIVNINFDDESSRILFFDYLVNYDESKVLETEEIKQLREAVIKIHNDIPQRKNSLIDERMFNICSYLVNHLEYDPESTEEIENHTDTQKNSRVYDLNKHNLSLTLNDDKDVKDAICINYAKLFTILAKMEGLKVRTVSAIDRVTDSAHAFNIVYYSEQFFYMIDAQGFDSYKPMKDLFELYENAEDEKTRSTIRGELLPLFFKNYNYLISFDYPIQIPRLFNDLEDNIEMIEKLDARTEKAHNKTIAKDSRPINAASGMLVLLVTQILASAYYKGDELIEEEREEHYRRSK